MVKSLGFGHGDGGGPQQGGLAPSVFGLWSLLHQAPRGRETRASAAPEFPLVGGNELF